MIYSGRALSFVEDLETPDMAYTAVIAVPACFSDMAVGFQTMPALQWYAQPGRPTEQHSPQALHMAPMSRGVRNASEFDAAFGRSRDGHPQIDAGRGGGDAKLTPTKPSACGRRRRKHARKQTEESLEAFAMQIDTNAVIGLHTDVGMLSFDKVSKLDTTRSENAGSDSTTSIVGSASSCSESTPREGGKEDGSELGAFSSSDTEETAPFDPIIALAEPFSTDSRDEQGLYTHLATGLKFDTKRTFIHIREHLVPVGRERRTKSIGPDFYRYFGEQLCSEGFAKRAA